MAGMWTDLDKVIEYAKTFKNKVFIVRGKRDYSIVIHPGTREVLWPINNAEAKYKEAYEQAAQVLETVLRPSDLQFLNGLEPDVRSEVQISRRYGKNTKDGDRYFVCLWYFRARIMNGYPS